MFVQPGRGRTSPTIATTMPTAPTQLPCRARAGFDRKRSARMKQHDRDQVARASIASERLIACPPSARGLRAS